MRLPFNLFRSGKTAASSAWMPIGLPRDAAGECRAVLNIFL